MDRAAGRDDDRGTDGNPDRLPVCPPGRSLNPRHGAACYRHALDVAAHDDARAAPRGVREIGRGRGLLRAVTTPVAAVAALLLARAATGVARDHAAVPAKIPAALLEDLVPPRRRGPLLADGQPREHPVRGLAKAAAGEQPQPGTAIPLFGGLVRQGERRRVVDDRAATETGAGENGNRSALVHEQA